MKRPYVPPSAGTVLRNELEQRGLTQKELCRRMRRPEQVISEIVQGKKRITAATALDLEAVLGVPTAAFWLTVQSVHELAVARARRRRK